MPGPEVHDKSTEHRAGEHTHSNQGTRFLLSSKFVSDLPPTLLPTTASRKFTARRRGPFKVEEMINDVAIRFKLPTTWRLHPVIHASYGMIHT